MVYGFISYKWTLLQHHLFSFYIPSVWSGTLVGGLKSTFLRGSAAQLFFQLLDFFFFAFET